MRTDLSVVLFTAVSDPDGERAGYARTTLATTLAHLMSARVHVHIADDGSPVRHGVGLAEIAGAAQNVESLTYSDAQGHGYGASMNCATQVVHQATGPLGIILPLEDDWECVAPIPWRRLTQALRDETAGIECIRLGYLGWNYPHDSLRGSIVAAGDHEGHDWDQEHYILLDPNSTERHVFAGHPRLETVNFERTVGPWPEGLTAQETEVEVCKRPMARIGVAWPLDVGMPLFRHIGTVRGGA